MMSSCRKKLLEEIYDQFLVCKICFEVYTSPKTLACLHTFCEQCIERHQSAELERSYRYVLHAPRTITCPICRKKTELPVGGVRRLPDNIIVPRLVDMVCQRGQAAGRNKSNDNVPLTVRCEICQIPNAVPGDLSTGAVAAFKCLDCCKVLCKGCTELHRRTKVTSEHSLVDVEVEDKDVVCKSHDGEIIRYYCEQCSMCICVVCAFESPHRGHEVLTFAAALSRHGHSLDTLVNSCQTKITTMRQQLERIRQFEAEINRAEEQVIGTTIDWIAAIRKHEKVLLAKLRAVFSDNPQVQTFIADKTSIESTLRAMENVCQLSDVIARERSVELLLLKDDLARRMTSLLQATHIELPSEIDAKSICFVKAPLGAVDAEGGFNFGRIDLIETANVTDDMRVDELASGKRHQNAERLENDDECHCLKNETEFEGTQAANRAINEQRNVAKRLKLCDTAADEMNCCNVSNDTHKKELVDQSTMTDWESAHCCNELITSSNVQEQPQSTEVHKCMEIPNSEVTLMQSSPTVNRSTPATRHTSLSSRSRSKSKSPSSLSCCGATSSTTSTPKATSSKTSNKIATRGGTRSRSVRCVSTSTDPPDSVNKSTVTERPFQLDKMVSTNRVRQSTKETNTPPFVLVDTAVDPVHIPRDDKCCGTPVIVAVDAFTSTSDRMTSRARVRTGSAHSVGSLPEDAESGNLTSVSVREKIGSFSNFPTSDGKIQCFANKSTNSKMPLDVSTTTDAIYCCDSETQCKSMITAATLTDVISSFSDSSAETLCRLNFDSDLDLVCHESKNLLLDSATTSSKVTDSFQTTISAADGQLAIPFKLRNFQTSSAMARSGAPPCDDKQTNTSLREYTTGGTNTATYRDAFTVTAVPEYSVASTITALHVSTETNTRPIETKTNETNTALKHDANTATVNIGYFSTSTNTPVKTYSEMSVSTIEHHDVFTNTPHYSSSSIATNTEKSVKKDVGSNTAKPVTNSVESNTVPSEYRTVETNTAASSSVGTITLQIECTNNATSTTFRCERTTNTPQIEMCSSGTDAVITADVSTSTQSPEIALEYCTSSTNTTLHRTVDTNTPFVSKATVDTNTAVYSSISTNTHHTDLCDAHTNTTATVSSGTNTENPTYSSVFTSCTPLQRETATVTDANMILDDGVPLLTCLLCGHELHDGRNSSLTVSVQTDAAETRDFAVGDGHCATTETGSGDRDVTVRDRAVGDHTVHTTDSSTATSPPAARIDKETVTAHVHMIHRNEATDSVSTVDTGTMPADDVTMTYRGALAAHVSKPPTVNRGTSTPAPPETVDHDTSTEPRPEMTDVGTTPAIDVSAIYRGLIGRQIGKEHRVTISRGTMTRPKSADRETTTEETRPVNVDRASSPIKFTGVDKSVSVNRASLTEPAEVFVRTSADTVCKIVPRLRKNAAGSATPATGGLRRQISGSCPRMDSICEGSDESASDGEHSTSSLPISRYHTSASTTDNLHRKPVLPPRPLSDDLRRFRLPLQRRILQSLSPAVNTSLLACRSEIDAQSFKETGTGTDSGVFVDGPRGTLANNRVEASTNTSTVELRDQSTGTDSLTSSAAVDGKMAECINKLRTVRQRLEQQQSIVTKCSSPPALRKSNLAELPLSIDASVNPETLQVSFSTEVNEPSVAEIQNRDSFTLESSTSGMGRVASMEKELADYRVTSSEREVEVRHSEGGSNISNGKSTAVQSQTERTEPRCRQDEQARNSTSNVGLKSIREHISTSHSTRTLKGDMFPTTNINKRFLSGPSSPSLGRKIDAIGPKSKQKPSSPAASPKLELQRKAVLSPPLKRGSTLSSINPRSRPTTSTVMDRLLRGTSSRTKLPAAIDEELKISMSGSSESTASSSGGDDADAVTMMMISGLQAAGSAAQRSRQHRQLQHQQQPRQRQTVTANTTTSSSAAPAGTASPVQNRKLSLARKQRLDVTQLLVSTQPLQFSDTTATSGAASPPQSASICGVNQTQLNELQQQKLTSSPVQSRRCTNKQRMN